MRYFVIFLLLCGDVFSSLNATESLNVSCEAPAFDAGDVELIRGKATITHSFRILNERGKDIKINKVSASCSCASVTYSEAVIKAGEEATIEVKMNLTDEDFIGRTAEVLVSFFETPKPVKLSLTAKAKFSSYVTPQILNFSAVNRYPGTRMSLSFFVCKPDNLPKEKFIRSIEISHPNLFKVEMKRQKRSLRKSEKGNVYYFFIAQIDVTNLGNMLPKDDIYITVTFEGENEKTHKVKIISL